VALSKQSNNFMAYITWKRKHSFSQIHDRKGDTLKNNKILGRCRSQLRDGKCIDQVNDKTFWQAIKINIIMLIGGKGGALWRLRRTVAAASQILISKLVYKKILGRTFSYL